MSTALTVAVISGCIAFVSAAVTVWGTLFSNGRTIRFEAGKEKARVEREISRYQEPLAAAVYDLQNRVFNLVTRAFIQRFITEGTEREREYAVENTTFVIAQYLCCVELLRRGVRSSGYGVHLINRSTMTKQDLVSSALGFLLFSGEQRAVGEALIHDGDAGLECMGYRHFLQARPRGEDRFLDHIRDEVTGLPSADDDLLEPFKDLHFLLLDLLQELDPDCLRFPQGYRRLLPGERRTPGVA